MIGRRSALFGLNPALAVSASGLAVTFRLGHVGENRGQTRALAGNGFLLVTSSEHDGQRVMGIASMKDLDSGTMHLRRPRVKVMPMATRAVVQWRTHCVPLCRALIRRANIA